MAPRAAQLVLLLGYVGVAGVAGAPAQEPQPGKEDWPKQVHTLQRWTRGLSFSPDGKTLAGGVQWGKTVPDLPDGGVILWDAAAGKRTSVLNGYRNPSALAFSPDGKLLAEGGDGIRLWDVATGKPAGTIQAHRGNLCALAFSPNGKLLASGAFSDSTRSNTVGLWEVETLKAAATAPTCASTVKTVAFSPDGKTLAYAGHGGEVRLWGVDIGRERAAIEPGDKPFVTCIAFSPDGKTLAVALEYHGVKSPATAGAFISAQVGPRVDHRDVTLWEVATGKAAGKLVGHQEPVSAVAFSPDSKLLASVADGDPTVRLWDVALGKTVATLEMKGGANQVAFSPDGKLLATASWSGKVINLWSLDRGK